MRREAGAKPRLREDEGGGVSDNSIVAETPSAANKPNCGWLMSSALGASVALLALQAFAAQRLELTFDEAYYTLWSRALAFGYLDHPPMVALFVRASTELFGGSEFGDRSLSLILVGALPVLIAFVAWRLFSSAETAAFAVLMWVAM